MKHICFTYDLVCTMQETLSTSVIRTNLLILYKAKVVICPKIHIKHMGKFNVSTMYNFLMLSLMLCTVTARL
jgi:hypothetical protein